MFKGCIVQRKQGQTIPSQYLEKVLAANTKVHGYSMILDGDLEFQSLPEPTTVEQLQELLTAFDNEMLLFFGEFSGEFNEEDVQPYNFTDADGDTLLCVYIAGDYSNMHKEKSARADAYHVFEDVISPRVQDIYELCDGDMDKLMTHLSKEIVVKEFTQAGKGVIALMADSGEVKIFGKTSSYEWGEVSEEYGYSEKEFPEKKLSMADRLRAMKAAKLNNPKSPPIVPAQEPVRADKTVVVPRVAQTEKKEPETATVVPKAGETPKLKTITLPADWKKWGNREKKSYQNKTFGTLIGGWKKWSGGTVTVPWLEGKEVLKDLSQIKEALPDPDEDSLQREASFQKDVTPHQVKSQDTLPAGASSSIPNTKASDVPFVAPSQREAFQKTFLPSVAVKAITDQKGSPLLDLEELIKLEAKTPSFSEQSGMEVIHAVKMPYALRVKFCTEYPQLAAVLMGHLSLQYLKNWKTPEVREEPEVIETPKVRKPLIKRTA